MLDIASAVCARGGTSPLCQQFLNYVPDMPCSSTSLPSTLAQLIEQQHDVPATTRLGCFGPLVAMALMLQEQAAGLCPTSLLYVLLSCRVLLMSMLIPFPGQV